MGIMLYLINDQVFFNLYYAFLWLDTTESYTLGL